jgi:hypothetical protein
MTDEFEKFDFREQISIYLKSSLSFRLLVCLSSYPLESIIWRSLVCSLQYQDVGESRPSVFVR